MADYWQARKAEKVFTEYRDLAEGFWKIQANFYDTTMGTRYHKQGTPKEVVAEETRLQEQINLKFGEVRLYAGLVGMNTTIQDPQTGVEGDLMGRVIERKLGWAWIDEATILDGINRCIGASQSIKKMLLWRQVLNPLHYLVVSVAFILRLPFIILEEAGIPKTVEESIWANVVKVVFLVALLLLGAKFGLKFSAGEILKALH